MSKHTPGLWTDDQKTGRDPRIIGALRLIKSDGFVIAFVPMWLDDEHVEARANARLIAAAPELLEALKAMLSHTAELDPMQGYRPEEDSSAVKQARAAIAKAESGA